MVTRAYFARRFLALKLLRGALVAGALYDAALAVLFLWWPHSVEPMLGLGAIVSSTTATLVAVWLAMLAGLGVAAARDTRRYSAIVVAVISGRTAAAVILATTAIVVSSHIPWPAAWSALLAVTLAATWWTQRG